MLALKISKTEAQNKISFLRKDHFGKMKKIYLQRRKSHLFASIETLMALYVIMGLGPGSAFEPGSKQSIDTQSVKA